MNGVPDLYFLSVFYEASSGGVCRWPNKALHTVNFEGTKTGSKRNQGNEGRVLHFRMGSG